ncbi:2-oxoacid dehydrogenases acyltransferase (catalytic domain) [Candidatus Izimaplasma bacterium HR1]|jgi:hypothetical protein|uniref:hypothetical protein n=1 Tax=Candidatus Izimoplasma sp. HR1 TaxID=1541959 RepID=UPI0004F7C1C4|nr:2-oxoacid dehydrogenases acyltransferase (catalytic domain) [Candidatus Izimaplasma bacterium HR1]
MKRRLGDRSDGWRLRKVDPFFKIIPHIMKERNDAQVFFSENIDLEETLKFIREIRREGYKVGFLQVAIATMVRVISQKPKINRFICGKKAYARNEIVVALAVKKEMSEEAEETTITIKFDPDDTIYEVIDKMNKAIDASKIVEEKNDTDKFVKVMSKVPGFIYGGVVGFLKFLDRRGLLPKFIRSLSPFHTSFFVTDLGSLGIKPVYHHLYNFGTTSIFIAFGTRRKQHELNGDNTIDKRKSQDLKVVVDERIVDGYYFSQAIKMATKIMESPSVLREKPTQIIIDDEI